MTMPHMIGALHIYIHEYKNLLTLHITHEYNDKPHIFHCYISKTSSIQSPIVINDHVIFQIFFSDNSRLFWSRISICMNKHSKGTKLHCMLSLENKFIRWRCFSLYHDVTMQKKGRWQFINFFYFDNKIGIDLKQPTNNIVIQRYRNQAIAQMKIKFYIHLMFL